MKYNGKVSEEGKLHIIHQKEFKADLMEFAGKNVTIEVRKKQSQRTLSQNAYYWGVLIPAVQERLHELYGEKISKEEVHYDFIVKNCNFKELINQDTGEVYRKGLDTRHMTKSEFGDFVDSAIQWSDMFLDIQIPLPDTQSALDFEEHYQD